MGGRHRGDRDGPRGKGELTIVSVVAIICLVAIVRIDPVISIIRFNSVIAVVRIGPIVTVAACGSSSDSSDGSFSILRSSNNRSIRGGDVPR